MKATKLLATVKQYPVAIGCTGGALLLAAALFLRSPNISSLRTELEAKDLEWRRMQENEVRADHIVSDVDRAKEWTANIEGRLMTREEVALNQSYFYGMEARTGVRILKLSQGKADMLPEHLTKIEAFDPIPYDVSLSGTFGDVVQFIYLLDHGQYVCRIDQVDLLREANAVGRGDITARLKIIILGRKPA